MATFQKGERVLHYESGPKHSEVLITDPGLRDIGIRTPGATIDITTDGEFLFPDTPDGRRALAAVIKADADEECRKVLGDLVPF
ncbi:hypothetical protein [Planctomyces sp. SH-PL14]|uniref:hypothetical protein n=1 Tax=Planctomyces sp. SH-PL14 TaxID=1632864 RepID=UPI00078C66D1|nr:hypothetical protein [Planctomyces sp. SH-PL14]AMV20458.1 hypothetical protein VT03_21345 [Planctomyces sp. SH-PL14]